jgi:hypothetical protein
MMKITNSLAILPAVNSSSRPISAGRDWPLYGDEYGRMKFGNYAISSHPL